MKIRVVEQPVVERPVGCVPGMRRPVVERPVILCIYGMKQPMVEQPEVEQRGWKRPVVETYRPVKTLPLVKLLVNYVQVVVWLSPLSSLSRLPFFVRYSSLVV